MKRYDNLDQVLTELTARKSAAENRYDEACADEHRVQTKLFEAKAHRETAAKAVVEARSMEGQLIAIMKAVGAK